MAKSMLKHIKRMDNNCHIPDFVHKTTYIDIIVYARRAFCLQNTRFQRLDKRSRVVCHVYQQISGNARNCM